MYRVSKIGIVYVSIYTIHDDFLYRVPNSDVNVNINSYNK